MSDPIPTDEFYDSNWKESQSLRMRDDVPDPGPMTFEPEVPLIIEVGVPVLVVAAVMGLAFLIIELVGVS